MRKLRLFLTLFSAFAAAPYLSAQQLALPDHFAAWTGKPAPEEIETEAPVSFLNLWKETGRTTGEFCEYVSGSAKVDVSVQKYRDPSSAYEAYTALLSPEMQPTTLGGNSAVNRERLFILLGNFVLDVRPPQAISTQDLLTLAKIVRAHSDQTPLPPIRQYLPESNLIIGTMRYALGPAGFQSALDSLQHKEYSSLGNELGFSSGAEVMLAEYRTPRNGALLLLIDYPTPQLAEQHLRHLEATLPASATAQRVRIKRTGSLLSLALAPTSAAYAESLQSAVRYETQVTWNEPTHKLTDPPWLLIVKNIFVGTIGFCLIAIILGVVFGIVRILTKRFFPGKVFDRPRQVEVLQLGLSGKRIDPSDFY